MKKYFNILIILVMLTSIWACQKTRLVYNGPLQLEFKNIYLEMQAALGAGTVATWGIVTDFNSTLNALTVRRSVIQWDSIRVQLIGPQQSQPITVNYTVNTNSTAQAGVHYNFVDGLRHVNRLATPVKMVLPGSVITGGSLVIPANTSFGYIYLQIPTTGGTVPATGVDLIINMTGGSLGDGRSIRAAANYATFTYNIRP